MAYTKTTWADRAVQFPNRYDKSGETSAQVTLTSNPGTVTQAGTPLNAANLNKLEQGVADAHSGVDTANTHIAATTGIHGAVTTAASNRLVIRDAAGRAQVVDPSVAADIATKGYVDAKFQTGAYTGDGAATRTISLGVTPKLVLVLGRWQSDGAGAKRWVFLYATGGKPTDAASFTTEMHTTNGGFLITAGTLNISGEAYDYFWWG